MASGGISGAALGSIAAGSVFLYAGIKGKSIPAAIQSVLQGKSPSAAAAANPITGSGGTGGGAGGGGGALTNVPSSPPGATATFAQVRGWWTGAGGPASVAPVAAAIAAAESALEVTVIQQGQPYATTGWGLWQITPGDSEPQAGTNQQLLNGPANAKAAVAKYRGAGNSFSPWTTYNDGAYQQYLQAAAA